MSILNLQAGYFSIENPLRRLDRWFNRYQYRRSVRVNRREVEVRWTRRAQQALDRRSQALIVEMQLYFSCVVKKRTLFHGQAEFETIRVNEQVELAFRPVSSAVCNPTEFAASYPPGQDLAQGAAARMVPRLLEIDYRHDQWEGQFSY